MLCFGVLFIRSRYLGAIVAKYIFINTTNESSVGRTCQSGRLEPDHYPLIWEESHPGILAEGRDARAESYVHVIFFQ